MNTHIPFTQIQQLTFLPCLFLSPYVYFCLKPFESCRHHDISHPKNISLYLLRTKTFSFITIKDLNTNTKGLSNKKTIFKFHEFPPKYPFHIFFLPSLPFPLLPFPSFLDLAAHHSAAMSPQSLLIWSIHTLFLFLSFTALIFLKSPSQLPA